MGETIDVKSDDDRAMQQAYEDGIAEGRRQERAAAVAFVRARSGFTAFTLANSIEREEHLRG